MRIKVKNNKNGNIKNEVVLKVAKFYLDKLIGEKAKDIKNIDITFKKLVYYRGGYLRTKERNPKNFYIAINSNNCIIEQLSTLAHECVHLKQYLLGELSQRIEYKRGRAKVIRIWKGRTYLRKVYEKRPWEVEARRLGKKFSYNVLNRIDKPQVEPKPQPQAIVEGFASKVLDILKGRELPNGELVPLLLNGSTDRQKRIQALKKVFALKQDKVIQEVNRNGLIYVVAV